MKKIKEKLKQNKRIIIEAIIIFSLTLLFNLLCNSIRQDEIWNYGFAYNIANGLIPYKDFNMIVTPLYPFLGALFLLIFGKSLLTFNIFNSILCVIIYYLLKKQCPKYYLIVYGIFLSFSLPNYNILCLLLVYLLIHMDNKKEANHTNDYIIGLLVGLSFITKQNLGILLLIPMLFTKNIKSILKRLFGFITPIAILLLYLLATNTLNQFINYAFLGMPSFIKNNFEIDYGYLIITVIAVGYLIYKYIKTRDKKVLYLLFFQGISFPIFHMYHIMIPFIPVLAEILNEFKFPKKLINIGFAIFIMIVFSFNIYLLMKDNVFPNETNLLKYKRLDENTIKSILTTKEYIESSDDELYIISSSAYLLKLETNKKINKFDLLNDGNLGKEGIQPLIDEIDEKCFEGKCMFLLDNQEATGELDNQYNKEIIEHILKKYYYKEKIENTSVLVLKSY